MYKALAHYNILFCGPFSRRLILVYKNKRFHSENFRYPIRLNNISLMGVYSSKKSFHNRKIPKWLLLFCYVWAEPITIKFINNRAYILSSILLMGTLKWNFSIKKFALNYSLHVIMSTSTFRLINYLRVRIFLQFFIVIAKSREIHNKNDDFISPFKPSIFCSWFCGIHSSWFTLCGPFLNKNSQHI